MGIGKGRSANPFTCIHKLGDFIMDFIVNIFKYIPTLPLIEYVAGGFAFSFLFYLFYRLVGVEK